LAGVEVPGNRVVGASKPKSACRAAMYLFDVESLFRMKNAGENGCICALAASLAAPLKPTCTLTGPCAVSTGVNAMTSVGLTYSTKAGLLLIVTVVPSRLVGSWFP